LLRRPEISIADDREAENRSGNLRKTAIGTTDGEPEKVRLLAEELNLGRDRVETGRVRVQVVTREHEEFVNISLTQEKVEIERIAINRTVDAVPSRRQDGDVTIIPVVEEVLVVERRLILKEELHVRIVRTTEDHQEHVVLRRQEAVITRIPAETPENNPRGE
jgi:uncharacterized protein (TIGR02271 family)